MDDIEVLERRVASLERKFAALQRLGEQDSAEIRADMAMLAPQLASFEQRTGRRFLGLETRMAKIETVQSEHTSLLQEILRRLPERS
jgi:DNA repair exonuclease SbcCD ATPase subunit